MHEWLRSIDQMTIVTHTHHTYEFSLPYSTVLRFELVCVLSALTGQQGDHLSLYIY
jgi:hypothetical protein